MIGNRISCGSKGYTILEQGDINRATLELDVSSWLVCRPDGSELGSYPTLALARQAVEQAEKAV